MATSSRPIRIGPLALLAVAGAAFGAASAGEVTTEYQYDEIGNLTRISDVSSDALNCGGTGRSCSTDHVAASCIAGSCEGGVCATGYADCNTDKRRDGCEVALFSTDSQNCGACGKACALGFACSAGTCVCQPRTCSSLGYRCGSASNGCGGTVYCGTCGTGYVCSGGECIRKQCAYGYVWCDGRCYPRFCP